MSMLCRYQTGGYAFDSFHLRKDKMGDIVDLRDGFVYVLVACFTKKIRRHKLTSTLTRPWRVVNDDREHVYVVEHPDNGETQDVHVARMWFYVDRHLHVDQPLQDVFQHLEDQGEYHICDITSMKKPSYGAEYSVQVE